MTGKKQLLQRSKIEKKWHMKFSNYTQTMKKKKKNIVNYNFKDLQSVTKPNFYYCIA
jgi:hypothetical protein